jgi:tRNA G46 methylase TrmB
LRNSDALRQVDEVEKFLALGDDFVKEVAEVVNRGPESESSPVLIVEGAEDAKKPLNFKEVFGNDLPVRLEVCSGHGDWVTERAQRDEGKANWLALEMRRNRIRMTWAKAVRRRLDNVALLCGMAHEMMGAHVASGSLTEVYVNYPDPPEWVGSLQCLVDQAFLRDAHRSLKPGVGHLTLVTDDPNYAMRMCRELSKVPGLFKSTEPGGKAFKSGVPEGYGGSYFDEMWKNGRQNDRYYIRYKRV